MAIASMEKRAYKDAIYEQIAQVTKALGSPKRLELLELLTQRPWTVDELAAEAGISIANASQHLQQLKAAGLVSTTRRAQFVEYSISSDDVAVALHTIRRLAEVQLAEIERITQRFVAGRKEFESIDREALLDGMRAGSVLLLDVRPDAEYSHAHLPGARSIPVGELKKRLRELPKRQKVVAYCRGPYCLFASEAVRMLHANGYKAVRYDEGTIDWQADGIAIERTTTPLKQRTADKPKPTTRGDRNAERKNSSSRRARS